MIAAGRDAANHRSLWNIRLLGGLEAEQPWPGGRRLTRFRTRRAALLLAYLALHRRRWHGRDELALLLWPDVDEERVGRQNLRQELSSLRHQLEPPGDVEAGSVLLADSQQVRLDPDAVTVDVDAFEAAAGGDALALYSGPFLPGFYDEWVLAERERLSLKYVACLRAVAEEGAGGTAAARQAALDAALRWVAEDPFDEDARLALVRLHRESGHPDLARRQYDAWVDLLRREMGGQQQPSRALRELVADLPPPAAVLAAEPAPQRKRAAAAVAEPAAAEADAAGTGAPAAEIPAEPLALPRLPLPLTRFFGREADVERVQAWLDSPYTRLITLTGPGGSGKTRLALEVVGTFKERRATCFVPCVDIADAALLPGAIADALGLPRGASDPLEQVVLSLTDPAGPPRRRRPPLLLILDNLEQIAEGAAAVVRRLLQSAPGLAILATSRSRLGVDGEQEYAVGPLPTPAGVLGQPADAAAGADSLPAALSAVPAVQLFVDRVQKVRPDFAVTPRNAVSVAALCDRLEGMPLAIELAAAWAGVLTPAKMLERLEQGSRFELLVARRRDAPARHVTLQAAIASSCDLLAPDLRAFFRQLAVFRGGWTADAAAAVCEAPDSLELLAQLAGSSLVLADRPAAEDESDVRFRLYESIREFAWLRLSEAERDAALRRHAAWCLSLADARDPASGAPRRYTDAPRWADRLGADLENVRAALRWTLDDAPAGDAFAARTGSRLAAATGRFWWMRGLIAEGRRWLDTALARVPEEDFAVRVDLHYWSGILAWANIDFDAADAHHREALAGYRVLGSDWGVASALNALGIVLLNRGRVTEALPLFEESLALYRRLDNRGGAALVLHNLGNAARAAGRSAEAQALSEECLRLYAELGDRWGIANAEHTLGVLAFDRAVAWGLDTAPGSPDLAEAIERLKRAGQIFASIDERWGIASIDLHLSDLRLLAGEDPAAVRAPLERSAAVFREIGNLPNVLRALCVADAVWRRTGPPPGAEAPAYVAGALRLLGERADAVLSADHAAAATLLRDAAVLLARARSWETAARLLGAADAAPADATTICVVEQTEAAAAAEAVRAALGETACAAHRAAGRALKRPDLLTAVRVACAAAVAVTAVAAAAM